MIGLSGLFDLYAQGKNYIVCQEIIKEREL